LSRADVRKIVDIQVDLVRKRLEDAGVKIEVSEPARERIARLGFDPQFGARPLKRVLQREILNELSKQILAGKVHKDSVIFVDLKNEVEFVFENLEDAEVLP
jgi:ATP-dependent Clp protease ATP-binding subunit ClpB